ncbi:MAG: endolytic transglycosylase MltG, partial [Nostocoides sp.]
MSSHLEQSIFGDAEHLDSGGRFQRRRRQRRRPRWRGLLAILLAIVVVGGAAYGSVQFIRPLYDRLTAAKDYPGPGTGSVKVTVHQGDAGVAIAETLLKAGVVKTTGAFTSAESVDPKAAQSIQPGVYTLKQQMKASDALHALTDPKNRAVSGVTVREGLWAIEIYPILSKSTGVPVADYVAAAKNPAIGLPASAKGNIEGYLFPDTYQFPEHATAVQQLTIMVKAAVTNLTKAGASDGNMENTL